MTVLDATTLGGLMARLSKLTIEGVTDPIYRNVNPSDVVLIVNPTDYWAKSIPCKDCFKQQMANMFKHYLSLFQTCNQ